MPAIESRFSFCVNAFRRQTPASAIFRTNWMLVFRSFCYARTGSFTAKANFICAQCSRDRSSNRSAMGLRELDRRRSFDPFGSDEPALHVLPCRLVSSLGKAGLALVTFEKSFELARFVEQQERSLPMTQRRLREDAQEIILRNDRRTHPENQIS